MPVAQVGDGETLQDWFNSIPLITKVFLVSTLLSGAMLTFEMIAGMDMVVLWPKIFSGFQVWRLFTGFIYAGPFSFNFAMHTYILYENCRRYENSPFNTGAGGNTADFLWMLMICMGLLLLVSYLFNLFVLSDCIMYVILYVWSRRDADSVVGMFGFKFKALYLPWIYLIIRVVMGGSPTQPFIGIAVGHIYYFLIEVLPLSYGYDIVKTPKFCVDIVEYCTGASAPPPGINPSGAGVAQARNANGTGLRNRGAGFGAGGYNWGQGRQLGAN